MADKSISLDELKKLRQKGAEVEFEAEITTIEQFDDLVAAVKAMVASEAERVRADIARNQTNLEILATLQSMIRKQGSAPSASPVDLTPIVELIQDIKAEREFRERASYEFEINRDQRGYMKSITANPTQPTKH